MKKKSINQWLIFLLFVVVIAGFAIYYVYFLTPKNSIELYQDIAFADDFNKVEKLLVEEYEGNFQEADFNYMKDHSPNWIGQFTVLEYRDKTYLIMTTPGTDKLEILSVEDLPEDIRRFFLKKREEIN